MIYQIYLQDLQEFGRAKTSADSNNGKNLVEFKINPPILITVLLVYCDVTYTWFLPQTNKKGNECTTLKA